MTRRLLLAEGALSRKRGRPDSRTVHPPPDSPQPGGVTSLIVRSSAHHRARRSPSGPLRRSHSADPVPEFTREPSFVDDVDAAGKARPLRGRKGRCGPPLGSMSSLGLPTAQRCWRRSKPISAVPWCWPRTCSVSIWPGAGSSTATPSWHWDGPPEIAAGSRDFDPQRGGELPVRPGPCAPGRRYRPGRRRRRDWPDRRSGPAHGRAPNRPARTG